MSQLVAKPPLNPASFDRMEPQRKDEIFLYYEDQLDAFRYSIRVLDRSILPTTQLAHACAAFLIPAGRESEYMFASDKGLRAIAESAQVARLICVGFGRSHTFASQEQVQSELTYVLQLLCRRGEFLP